MSLSMYVFVFVACYMTGYCLGRAHGIRWAMRKDAEQKEGQGPGGMTIGF